MDNITYLLNKELPKGGYLCKMNEKDYKNIKLVKILTKQRKRLELYIEIG